MTKQTILWPVLLALGICSSAFAQPATPGDAGRIAELIKNLASSNYQERVTAQNALEAIGVPALEQLKAIMQRSDLETSRRARELVRKIEEKEMATVVLAPRRVRLNIKDMRVREAVTLLAKESGYSIEIADNRADLAQRRITLDMGLVPFWEAFEILSKRGGLAERGPPPRGAVGLPSDFMKGAIRVAASDEMSLPKSNRILLSAGPPLKLHSNVVGSVRVRLYEVPGAKGEDYRLLLEAKPEPRLQGFTLVGLPRISRAVDDVGQERVPTSEIVHGAEDQQRTLRFAPGEKSAKTLRILSGNIDARIMGPNEPITLNKVLKATGVSARGKNGVQIKLVSIKKSKNLFPEYCYDVCVFIENLVLGDETAFELFDANGNSFSSWWGVDTLKLQGNKLVNEEFTISFFVDNDQGDPETFVFHGNAPIETTVPFAFEHVALD